MFVRFFKPKITSAQAESLLVTANIVVNIGYQAMMFGKEKNVKNKKLLNKESMTKARNVLLPTRALR